MLNLSLLAVVGMLVFQNMVDQRRRALALVKDAHARSEALLLNVLPPSIAERLKASPGTIADRFDAVTILFADIVGFTALSARVSPEKLVELLNDVFTQFDALADRHGLEKIKTIGDAYMVVGGLPQPRADHAAAVARMSLRMLAVVEQHAVRLGHPLSIRVGIHSGPAVAGVIGRRKFIYDLWGDAVNTASRMESHGQPGQVQVSEATQRLLNGTFVLRERGTIEVKGKGAMTTWFLERELG
ncbi:MAG: adenylate/guanylate cyclase domain-containing protein [Deltaproteobacteria bacterium]|nr:adenylate/guanylate cyclase domain-containing protein [Deltaproteobacteria bacterium]